MVAAPRPVWLVLPDPFPARVFVECGIVAGLNDRLGDRLSALLLLSEEDERAFAPRLDGVRLLDRERLLGTRSLVERVRRRGDIWLDDRAGFYPLALRHTLRHGFHPERLRSGHDNWFLDTDRIGPLPRRQRFEHAMLRWHYSRLRYVPERLNAALRDQRPALVVANLQTRTAVPFLVAARSLRLPTIGYVSSWDHTVGKGVMSPYLDRYVVQNETMRDDIVRFHEIPAERVVVTGWPQTDVFAVERTRASYDELLRDAGLDPALPVVLFAGNTPTNAPYEGRLVERLVAWWERREAPFSLVLRPHPRDRRWRERFAAALGRPGAWVQEPSYTDLDVLATVLQHVDCVVANAGTVLLDAIVNDRAAVCVLFDEGAPTEERWAELNVSGHHYRALVQSDAFARARSFEELTAGIERALADPGERAAERARVSRVAVGEVDGHAAERVVSAILDAVG
jgi:hypothetical protein